MKDKNNNVPKPIGPYSPAINYNDLIFTSGQIPIDPITSKLIEGNFKMRVEQVLNNIKSLLN